MSLLKTPILLVLYSELRKQVKVLVSYYVDTVIRQIVYVFAFIMLSGLMNIVTNSSVSQQQRFSFFAGYVVWWVVSNSIIDLTKEVAHNTRWGTLEQTYLTGISPIFIMLAKSLAIFLYYNFLAIVFIVLVTKVFHLPVGTFLQPIHLFFYIFTLAGGLGLGLIIVGCHIVYKNLDALGNIYLLIAFPLSGILAPIDFDMVVYVVSRLLPLTSGIALMRQVSFHTPIASIFTSKEFLFFLMNTMGYMIIGIFIVQWGFRKAKKDGSLAHY